MDEKKRKEHGKDEEDIVFDFELFSFALSCPPLSFFFPFHPFFLSSIPLLLLVSEVATWKGKTMKRNRKKEIIRLLPKEDISDGRRKRMRERGRERMRERGRKERKNCVLGLSRLVSLVLLCLLNWTEWIACFFFGRQLFLFSGFLLLLSLSLWSFFLRLLSLSLFLWDTEKKNRNSVPQKVTQINKSHRKQPRKWR